MKEVSVSEALNTKYPESIVLVTSVDAHNKPNIITLGWSMQTSFDPPMLAISVGKTRYSHDLIKDCGHFVLAFPSEFMKDEVLYCGTHSGKNVDKFHETGLVAVKSKHVHPPLIEGCVANFECEIVGKLATGDHTIFAGKVVAAYTSGEQPLRRIYTLGGGDIGSV